MANPAINVALIAAAQQQALSARAITDQLEKADAVHVRAAMPLDLSVKDSDKMLAYLIKRGHVREAGGGRYWLDRDAVAHSRAAALHISLIVIAVLVSVGASLVALLATR